MEIKKMLIKHNYSKRSSKIEYIVIHDTGNKSKGADVKRHFNYFNNGNRGSSADYFVDDNIIGQFVEDINYSWHCGDGKGKKGITNNNSIGIEICINSDGNYEKTIENTVKLIVYLMKKYNIDYNRVVRHYDASGKYCPNSMKDDGWEKWLDVKNKIKIQYIVDSVESKTPYLVIVNANVLNIRKDAGTEYEIVGKVKKNEVYTIIEVKNGFGRLKSGMGWISLNYTTKL